MNFHLEQSNLLHPEFQGKQNKLVLRKSSHSFRSNSSLGQHNNLKMSESFVDDTRKSAIISFKDGSGKKKSLAGKFTNVTCTNEKVDSPMAVEKKSKFCLDVQPQSAGLKRSYIMKADLTTNSKEFNQEKAQGLSFKKKVTFDSKKSFIQGQNSPHKLMFSTNSKASLRSNKQQTPRQRELKLDDFVQGKFLGKGIFGQVVMVMHKETGWMMAMKIMNKQTIIKDQKLMSQVISQIKIHSFVNHPNICSMYGFFVDETNIYLLLQLCTDKSLYSIMKHFRQVPQQIAVDYLTQVTASLDYLHFNDIIHRDIKPQNILISYDVVKLADFGWSAHCISGMRNTVCGTPLYLSPQLIKGQQYSDQADIWALGILSYQLICGRPPFRVMDKNQLTKIVNDEVKFPMTMQISENCQDFIFKCLEKEQQHRANTADLKTHSFLKTPEIKASDSFKNLFK